MTIFNNKNEISSTVNKNKNQMVLTHNSFTTPLKINMNVVDTSEINAKKANTIHSGHAPSEWAEEFLYIFSFDHSPVVV